MLDSFSLFSTFHLYNKKEGARTYQVVMAVFTYLFCANTEVRGAMEYMYTLLSWQIVWRAEFEGSENYTNDNMATGKRYGLIIRLYTIIYCCHTIAQQSGIGTMGYELVYCYEVSNCLPVALLGQKVSAYYLFSGWMFEPYRKQFCEELSQTLYLEQTFLMPHKLQPATQRILTGLSICEPSEESCCCVWISLDLHRTISLADSGRLGWGSQGAVLCEIGSELPLHVIWTCSLKFYDSQNVVPEQLPGYEILFVSFDRQAISRGGSCAMIPLICYLGHDNYIDFLNYLNFNGLKEPQVQWDPGGSELVGSSTSTTWGQAVFQGGRGVRVPPYTSTWVWAWLALKDSSWAWPSYRPYKYQTQDKEETIQTDHEPAASSSPTSVSLSPCTSSSLNPNPLLLHLYP